MISDDVKKAFELGKKEGREETKKWIEGLIDELLEKYEEALAFGRRKLIHRVTRKAKISLSQTNNSFSGKIRALKELKKQICGEGK